MTNYVTAQQAQNLSIADLVVHDEISYIMRQIITAGSSSSYEVIIADETTMTTSTPTITVTGTVTNPVIGPTNETFIIAGTTVTLTANHDVDQIVAAINDATPGSLVASTNSSKQIVLTFNPPMDNWVLTIGAGTANLTLGFTESGNEAPTPGSARYYSVWVGDIEDRAIERRMSAVINHFQSLGFKILRRKNTSTNSTFQWEIYW